MPATIAASYDARRYRGQLGARRYRGQLILRLVTPSSSATTPKSTATLTVTSIIRGLAVEISCTAITWRGILNISELHFMPMFKNPTYDFDMLPHDLNLQTFIEEENTELVRSVNIDITN